MTLDQVKQESSRAVGAVVLRELETDADAVAFRMLNEEWITRFFKLEAKDIETLGDPRGTILAKGGRVFLVEDGAQIVGCAALISMGDGVFELSKMAVSPAMRGRGIGRVLILHVIEAARAMRARSLFLGSSKQLANAVHLYEAVGFQHVLPEQLPRMAYTRADVFMEMVL